MKRLHYILLIILVFVFNFQKVTAQDSLLEAQMFSEHVLRMFGIEQLSEEEWGQFEAKSAHIIDKVGRHQSQKVPSRLRKLHRLMHTHLLKRYVSYPEFYQTIRSGAYNCVTGTALYAWMLQQCGFKFEIKEVQHHVYLLVQDGENRILVEPTSPIYGILTEEASIKKTEARYVEMKNDPKAYQSHIHYRSSISLRQLAGLQYYNRAVGAYNAGNYDHAILALEDASVFYPGERVSELIVLSVRHLLKSKDMPLEEKRGLLERYADHFEHLSKLQALR